MRVTPMKRYATPELIRRGSLHSVTFGGGDVTAEDQALKPFAANTVVESKVSETANTNAESTTFVETTA
jgi:hypothetical protein